MRTTSRVDVCLFLSKLVPQLVEAILLILGTSSPFCCTQYICRNRPDRIPISYNCHWNKINI